LESQVNLFTHVPPSSEKNSLNVAPS
jgi:hypothetical protein